MMVIFNEVIKKKHDFIQFVAMFWHMKLGKLLTNFENMK